MEICPSCNLEISSKNANSHLPFGGLGKLSDGNRICFKCYTAVSKRNSDIAVNSKKYTLDQINELLKSQEEKSNFIEEQLLNIGIDSKSTIWGKSEIKELPKILSENEKIKGIITGIYNGGSGILVATDFRLVFIDKGLLFGLKIEDFGFDKISSIQFESGFLTATIKIIASGNEAKISNVESNKGRTFCDLARQLLSQPKKSEPQIVNQEPDILGQLEKLGKLKDAGIITEEEFTEQKKKLLEKL